MTLEATINYLIKNGNRIQEQGLGDVLPTKQSLKINDEFAAREKVRKSKLAASNSDLKKCERRMEGGEVRYYASANRYAVISSRSNATLWFEIRNGMSYRA